jgi:hypothetical protein
MQSILKMFHGTQAVPLQIANRFNLWGNLLSVSDSMISSEVTNVQVKHFLKANLFGYTPLKNVTKSDNVTFIGPSRAKKLDVEEKFLIERLLGFEILANATSYKKVIWCGIKVGSILGHLNRSRRNNYTVVTKQGRCLQIQYYVTVKRATGSVENFAIGIPIVFENRLVGPDLYVGQCCSHIQEFRVGEGKIVCLVGDIKTKCSVIKASRNFPIPICCVHPRFQLTT